MKIIALDFGEELPQSCRISDIFFHIFQIFIFKCCRETQPYFAQQFLTRRMFQFIHNNSNRQSYVFVRKYVAERFHHFEFQRIDLKSIASD